jgi:hypothetical protein
MLVYCGAVEAEVAVEGVVVVVLLEPFPYSYNNNNNNKERVVVVVAVEALEQYLMDCYRYC